MNQYKKDKVIESITDAIAAGSQVCIYRGTDLTDNDFPTRGVAPVYIGRILKSALLELDDASGDAIEWGRLEIVRTNEVLKGPHDIINFDFR